MWNFIGNLPQSSLDSWFRWLTICAISLPVFGAITGGLCGWGAFNISTRMGDLQTEEIRNAERIISRQSDEIEAIKPWHLSDDQQKRVKEELHSLVPKKIAFIYRLMDGDGKDFAEQLATIFKASGWEVGGIGGNSLNDLPNKVTVAINSRSGIELMTIADRLCDSLNRVGIPCGGELKPDTIGGPLEIGIVYIVIGRKQRNAEK